MKNARMVWIAAGLALVLVGTGCKKKAPATAESGVTEGVKPEAPAERVEPPTPVTPPLEQPGMREGEIATSPLQDVYFDFDRYEIRTDQRPALEANSRWLLANPGQSILIEGHCDERGTEEYNLALGDRRANAAKEYLRTLGVPAARMSTVSYGEAYPADPGHNEEAWAKNRRAHSTLVAPKGGAAGR